MRYDVRLIPDSSGEVSFTVRGKSEDTGLMLLQRLYVLLFSPHGTNYRPGSAEWDMLAFMDGANIPPDEEMNAMLALGCSYALEALDDADRALVDSFSCVSVDGLITGALVLADGTTIEGTIQYE